MNGPEISPRSPRSRAALALRVLALGCFIAGLVADHASLRWLLIVVAAGLLLVPIAWRDRKGPTVAGALWNASADVMQGAAEVPRTAVLHRRLGDLDAELLLPPSRTGTDIGPTNRRHVHQPGTRIVLARCSDPRPPVNRRTNPVPNALESSAASNGWENETRLTPRHNARHHGGRSAHCSFWKFAHCQAIPHGGANPRVRREMDTAVVTLDGCLPVWPAKEPEPAERQ